VTIDWSDAGLKASMVSTEVAGYLEQLILSGQVKPGDKLPPERDIADKLGVSRTSVRHAMVELTLKGLTDRKPGRGTTVLEPSPRVGELLGTMRQAERHMRHIVDLRQVIEPSIAERAAEGATENDLRRMALLLERSTPDLDPAESARLDEQFHEAVARATQNPLLTALVGLRREWLGVVREESHGTREGRSASIHGHRQILAAIEAKDSHGAMTAMSEHIKDIGLLVRGS
jgi:GntR family transcriptional regulator, transcriptional repressor for pyruvate dehydrogenase complex